MSRRTPAEHVAGDEQTASRSERLNDERSQVETLAEHPEEVTRDKVLRDDVKSAAPDLHT